MIIDPFGILVYHHNMKPQLKSQSRGDLLALLLKTEILKGQYRPGEALVEREIAARFGTSKTPVREALRSLAASRLIVMVGYKAAFVQPLDRTTITDVFELRRQLEPWAVVKALDNLEQHHIVEMQRELSLSIEAVNRADWLSASTASGQFHRQIYAQCGNRIACDILDNLQELMLFITINMWKHKPTWPQEIDEHIGILDAIKSGDRRLIERKTSRHIAVAHGHFLEMLEANETMGSTERLKEEPA